MVGLWHFDIETGKPFLQGLINTYGYWAVLVGSFLEGETILVLGGFAAHRGFLSLPWVMASAFAGSLLGDQLFFFLGRKHSGLVLKRFPKWKAKIDQVHDRLEHVRIPLMLGFRFLYGLRIITPFVIGMSPVPTRLFVGLNAAGALVWSVAVGAAGYLFGAALQAAIGDIKHYEFLILAGITLSGLSVWGIHLVRVRRRKRRLREPGT